MVEKNESEELSASAESSEGELANDEDRRVYVDSSAMAKLYVPEPESEALDEYLQEQQIRIISELVITEVISAVARRRREGVLDAKAAREIRNALMKDAASGSFQRLDLSPAIHREAERILMAAEVVPLRALDALHIALALSGDATRIVTFDDRLKSAAALQGLEPVEF